LDVNKLAQKEVNFKSRLLEWGQRFKSKVVFDLIEETIDSENNTLFQTQIIVNGVLAGYGVGYSKKESQQNAAKIALKKVKTEKELFLKAKWENAETEQEEKEDITEQQFLSPI
jgi:ribonuclease-3